MTTLHDRLADLADEAPAGGPAPGLWDQGRRIRRRQRLGTTAIIVAVVVLLVGVLGLDWQRSAPAPEPTDGPAGLPDKIWSPSPWLPSTSRPGRLVVLRSSDRGTWTGTEPGLVGISAQTGDYAFLDLPDVWTRDAELSPDGRHVAYWFTGDTTGTPNTSGGPPVTGLAVYDTSTGDVERHPISTAHGVEPAFLAWADPHTVVFSAGQIVVGDDGSELKQGQSKDYAAMVWPLGDGAVPIPGNPDDYFLEGAAHGWVLLDHRLIDLDAPQESRRVSYPQISGSVGGLHSVAISPGGQLATVPGNRNPNDVAAGPSGRLRSVPDTKETWGVVCWLDEHTLVTYQRIGGWRAETSALVRHDLGAGSSERLVSVPTLSGDWQFATDLLTAPTYAADAPPRPLDPRVVWGGCLAIVLAGIGTVVLWRRRVRA